MQQMQSQDLDTTRTSDTGPSENTALEGAERGFSQPRGNRAAQQAMGDGGSGGSGGGPSGGFALDNDLVQQAVGVLGQDLEGPIREVRVHTDAEAEARAASHNANAFHEGGHIYFSRGMYQPRSPAGWQLLLEEITHALQPANAPQGDGQHTSTSDAAEAEAKDIAARGAQGEATGGPSQAAGAGIQRDAVSELDEAADGNWIGNVDEGECLRRLEAMSEAERQTVANRHDLMRKLCGAFNGPEMFRFLMLMPLDLRWRVYWLIIAGEVDSLSAMQWTNLVADATDANFEALRSYPTGWTAFLENAPVEVLPPIERLRAMASGSRGGDVDPAACLNAITELSEPQKTEVRDDHALMNNLAANMDATQLFQATRALGCDPRWCVYWLAVGGEAGNVSEEQWSALLLESTDAEFTALTNYEFGWNTITANVSATRISLIRAYRDPVMITTYLQSPALLDMMINNMGAASVLLAATQEGTDAAANYAAINAAGKVDTILGALPRGSGLSDEQKAALKRWFDLETGVPRLCSIMSVRFNFAVGDDGTRAPSHNNATTTLQAWSPELLRASWDRLEQLPAGHVEGNDELDWFLRKNDGSSYYWSADDSIAMGHSNLTDSNGDYFLEQDGETDFQYNTFNAHLRHEVGHAVDARLGVTSGSGYANTAPSAGRWVQYADGTDWLTNMLSAGGGVSGDHADAYNQACQDAVSNEVDLNVALQALKDAGTVAADVPAIPDTGVYRAIFLTARWLPGSRPWNSNGWGAVGGRNWHRAYSGSRWVSFEKQARDSNAISNYQWRAPGEWFAELYAAYYADIDEDNRPGTRLRGKDPIDAAWMDTFVDAGHSLAHETGQVAGGEGGGVGNTAGASDT